VLWHFDELSEFARSGHGGFNATSDRGHSRRNSMPSRRIRAMSAWPPIATNEKGIAADRPTTQRLLVSIGARKSEVSEGWTLNPL
jgi:hypothetical protein